MAEVFDVACAQKLVHAELPDEPPVLTVARESQRGIVGEAFDGDGFHAVDECVLVGVEEEFGEVGRRSDDAGKGSEVKREEGSVLEGEGVEGLVEEGTQEVHVPYYWEAPPWRGREMVVVVVVEIKSE